MSLMFFLIHCHARNKVITCKLFLVVELIHLTMSFTQNKAGLVHVSSQFSYKMSSFVSSFLSRQCWCSKLFLISLSVLYMFIFRLFLKRKEKMAKQKEKRDQEREEKERLRKEKEELQRQKEEEESKKVIEFQPLHEKSVLGLSPSC